MDSSRASEEAFRLERELSRSMGRCIGEYGLIEANDRVMVCLSGGKDSYTLLHLLERARRRSPDPFAIEVVHLDQGHPGYDNGKLVEWLKARNFSYHIVSEDTYSIVKKKIPKGKTTCSLCSRLRRGVLYRVAKELGCTKIALGHHADDAIETLLLNLMFAGSLGAMPARLAAHDEQNVVIRPLLLTSEDSIRRFSEEMKFPILPCNLCGSQSTLQRAQVKELIRQLEGRIPHVRQSMLAALQHVRPTHLLDLGLDRVPSRST